MRYVYGIAFRDSEFIMVFNPKRGGWEMPGGKVEEGESDTEAMHREFREEVGHEIKITANTEVDGVAVYAGELGSEFGPAEMEWRGFEMLPEQLSFPLVEYLSLIAWAREATGRGGSSGAGSSTIKD